MQCRIAWFHQYALRLKIKLRKKASQKMPDANSQPLRGNYSQVATVCVNGSREGMVDKKSVAVGGAFMSERPGCSARLKFRLCQPHHLLSSENT
jgi:hypothetical protein